MKIDVSVGALGATSAVLYPASKVSRAKLTLILAHGAGAGQVHPFMVAYATDLAKRGIDCVTFNFLYTERGKRSPDRQPTLEACWEAVIKTVRGLDFGSQPLFIGGKSMGGRMASYVAARWDETELGPLSGLVFLGYPLHPPGQRDKLRAEHLPRIRVPMLFVQGSHDEFGTPDEIRAAAPSLFPASTLRAVEGGDHSLKPKKRSADDQSETIKDDVLEWMKGVSPRM